MTCAELLDEIEATNGQLVVRPDRSLECRNIAPRLRPEIERLAFALVAILLGECDAPDAVPGKAKKIITRSRKKRLHCEICASGRGCRTGLHEWQPCPLCGHACRSHHRAYASPLYGVIVSAGCHWPREACRCPGWPEKQKKPRRKAKNLNLPIAEDHHEQPGECA